ncbi:MAG: hypothetical protein Q4G63_10065 [Bacteroidia bacterium]|nr:hypothetical protein [Bacteroidia bacterium]
MKKEPTGKRDLKQEYLDAKAKYDAIGKEILELVGDDSELLSQTHELQLLSDAIAHISAKPEDLKDAMNKTEKLTLLSAKRSKLQNSYLKKAKEEIKYNMEIGITSQMPTNLDDSW